jgi:hypothetical protein
MLLQEFLGRRGHQGRNLRFLLHVLFYPLVAESTFL